MGVSAVIERVVCRAGLWCRNALMGFERWVRYHGAGRTCRIIPGREPLRASKVVRGRGSV